MATCRLTIVAAFLVFGVLFAIDNSARAHRTTITTVELDSDLKNPGPYQQCEDQIRSRNLRQCEQYIRQGRQYGVLELKGKAEENPSGQQQLQQCCDELRRMSEQCQCEAMETIVRREREQQGQQQMKGGRLQQMLERARELPGMCRSGPQYCDIRED